MNNPNEIQRAWWEYQCAVADLGPDHEDALALWQKVLAVDPTAPRPRTTRRGASALVSALLSLALVACVSDRSVPANCDDIATKAQATPGECQAFYWPDQHVALGGLLTVDGSDKAEYTDLITTNGEPGVIVWRDGGGCYLDPCVTLPAE